MSSATGAPVFSDSLSSFLSCSFFKKRAVRFMRFMTIKYHTGIHVSIGRRYQATRRFALWRRPALRASVGTIPGEESAPRTWLPMGKFSPTKRHGDCEEIDNPSTAYGRRRRNWIDAHGAVPAGQVVDARCGNEHCIALRHAHVRPRVEQPGKYRKIAARVHRLKVGQHFEVPGVGTDERSRNRFRSGLYAAARLDRVSVRGLPDGSVRVTKVGEWSNPRG
jgi:hypothetical protein